MSHDIRGIANFVLDTAKARGGRITNMAINKIVYFLYVDHLMKFGHPMSRAKIEAWEHGPVFRELYSAFKSYGDSTITGRAGRIDPDTGNENVCEAHLSSIEIEFLRPITERLVVLSAARLRSLSHLPGSPWDKVWNHTGVSNAGMHISDEVILSCASKSWRQ